MNAEVHDYMYVMQQHTMQNYAQRESVLNWHQ